MVPTRMGGIEIATLKKSSFSVSLILLASYPFLSLSCSSLHCDVPIQAQNLTYFRTLKGEVAFVWDWETNTLLPYKRLQVL